MNKKIIALSLATVSAFSVVAGATFKDDSKIEFANKYAVNTLEQYNIINGDPSGNFLPDKTVTRAEMAKMISVMTTKGEPANKTTKFKDTKNHWAEKYIADCVEKGIIAGKSSTEFAPNELVTGNEAAKMLLIALGVDANKAQLVGSEWVNNTRNLTHIFEVAYDVDGNLKNTINKETAAQMISNTLNSKVAVYNSASTSSDDIYKEGTETLLEQLKMTEVETDMTRAIYNALDEAELVGGSMGGSTNHIESLYKLDPSLLVDAHLSMNTISATNEEIFIAEVKPSKMNEVKKAIEARKVYIKSNSLYPGHHDAIDLSKIYTNGNYIMYYVSANQDNYAPAEKIFKDLTK